MNKFSTRVIGRRLIWTKLHRILKPVNQVKKLVARKRRQLFPFALGAIVILIPVFYLVLKNPSEVKAAWFNDTWAYRKAVSVANSAGSTLTDYQVSITVDTAALITAGKLQADCDDIRITDLTGKLIPQWVEDGGTGSCNSTTTRVWTKLPSIPTSGTTVYLYYGNSTAASVSNGATTFDMFDTFSGSTVDANTWTTTGSPTVASGTVALSSSAGLVSKATKTDSSGLGRLIYRAKQAATTLTGGKIGFSDTASLATHFNTTNAATSVLGSTEEQVTQTASTNLVSYHRLEETTSTDANQFKASGYLDTGKLSQAVSMYGNAAGTQGSTLTFNRGAQISGNNYEHINTNQGTISFWFKPSWNGGSQTYGKAFFSGSNNSSAEPRLLLDTNGALRFLLGWNGSNYTESKILTSGSSIVSGNWYFITMRWDADNNLTDIAHHTDLMVNGSNASTLYVSDTTVSIAPDRQYFVGSDGTGTQQAQALIDDFAIFDRVLTTTEIASLYNSGTGNEAGYVADPSLKFYAKLDGSGTLAPVTYNAGANFDQKAYDGSTNTNGNMVTNGDMEAASGGLTTGWINTSVPNTTPADAESSSILFDARSQKVTTSGYTSAGIRAPAISVSASNNYVVSGWVKSDGTNSVRVYLYDFSNSAAILTYYISSSSWTNFNLPFKTPAGCTNLGVYVITTIADSHVWYVDNVTLTPNLVDNGGMEGTYSSGVAPGWTFAGTGTPSSSSDVHSGSESQKIIGNDLDRVWQNVSATAGNSYLLSFWGKKESGTTVEVFDSSANSILVPYQLTITSSSWARYAYVYKALDTAVDLSFRARDGAATFYIDDVSVLPLDNVATAFKAWTPVNDTQTTGSELLSNTGFETPGGGGADIWANWEEDASDGGTLTNETTLIHGGASAAKIATAGTNQFAKFRQVFSVSSGKTYKVTFWTRGDGTNSGDYIFYNLTGGANIGGKTSIGITSTSYQQVSLYVVAPAGSSQVAIYFFSSVTAGAVAYIDDVSAKESNSPLSIQGALTGVTSTTSGARGNGYTFDGSGYLRQKTYDVNVGTLTYQDTNTDISDDGQEFEDWDNDDAGSAEYMIVVTNSDDTISWGYFCANDGGTQTAVYTLKACTGGSQGFNGTSPSGKTPVGYEIRKTDYQITGNLTVGAWVKAPAADVGGIISKNFVSTQAGGSYSFDIDGSANRLLWFNGANNIYVSYTPDTNWHFYSVSLSGTTATFYVDGVSLGNGSGTAWVPTDSYAPLTAGFDNYWNANELRLWSGSIDSPFVTASALTADQIKDIYNSTASHYGLTTNLAGVNSQPANSSTPTVDANTYHTYQLNLLTASSILSQDGTTIATSTTTLPNTSQYVRLQNADTTNALTVDWLAVAKGAAAQTTSTPSSTEEKSEAPVGYWKFDEGQGTTANNSGNGGTGLNGSITDATWQTEDMCVSGKCLKFDGSDDYIDAADNPEMGTNNWTVEAWIRTSQATAGRIVSKDNNGNNATWEIGINTAADNKFSARLINTGGTSVFATSSTSVNDNKWHHVVAVWNRSGNLQTYIDGRTDGSPSDISASSGQDISNAYNLSIGKRTAGSFYNGFIDDVKIFPYVRTLAQIKTDYNAGKAGMSTNKGSSASMGGGTNTGGGVTPGALSNGLVGYWKMDDNVSGNSQTLIDSSGTGNNGTTYYGANAAGMDCTTIGRYNKGCAYDGTDDYVTVAHNASLNSGTSFTLSSWFKATSFGSNSIISKGDWNTINSYSLDIYASYLRCSIGRAWNYGAAYATSNLSTGTWYHAVCIADPTGHKLYLNGNLVATSTDIPTAVTDASFLNFGTQASNPTVLPFSGSLDEVRIYNRALSAQEVKALYQWSPTAAVQYKMDEKTGSTLTDSSANSNTATHSGNPLSYTTLASWVTGRFGGGANFDGIDDYYTAADSVTADQGGSLTVAANIKPAKVGSNYTSGTIMAKGGNYTLGVNSSSANQSGSTNLTNNFFTTSNITTQLSGTSINDVYFYDTTKDTDYGTGKSTDPLVWRYDSTKSWYSETIDATARNCVPATHDRCGSKEFPEKSYIVATASNVYIFDAAENAMWMRAYPVFATFPQFWRAGGRNATSVMALNGKIFFGINLGTSDASSGLSVMDFVADKLGRYSNGDTYGGKSDTIVNRNSVSQTTLDGSYPVAVDTTVNDVHAAVISGKTYVAVATDGGISIINETDGTVVSSSENAPSAHVQLLSNGNLYWDSSTRLYYDRDVTNGISTGGFYMWNTIPSIWNNPYVHLKSMSVTSGTSTIDGTSDTIYLGLDELAIVLQEKQGDETNGSAKYITKDYITEEMIGDIRGMWPLSADDQSATSADASVKGETLTSVSMTSSSDVAGVRGKGLSFDGSADYLKQTPATSYSEINQDAGAALFSSNGAKQLAQGVTVVSATTVGTTRLYMNKYGSGTASTQGVKVEIQTDGGGIPSGTAISNGVSNCVSTLPGSTTYVWVGFKFATDPALTASTQYHLVLKPYTDSSCNTLQTVLDAVNGYNWGFDNSSSSYSGGAGSLFSSAWTAQGWDTVFELYNNNFDITGSLTVGAWVNSGTGANDQRAFITKDSATTTDVAYGLYGSYLNWDKTYFQVSSNGTTRTGAENPNTLSKGTWHYVVGVYVPSTSVTLYVDGAQVAQNTTSIPASIYDSSQPILIGEGIPNAGGYKFKGTIDEPFVTAEALTASQIKRMYEVGLRAKTAAGTSALNGSSNQVNAVVASGVSSYIDSSSVRKITTQKLYAGTEGGGVSEIDLGSDTLVNYYTAATTPAINHANVNALAVSPGGSFIAALDSGVSRLDDVSGKSNATTSTNFTHVAGTYDKVSGYYYLYENGQEVGKTYIGTSHSPVTNSVSLSTGGYPYNSGYGYLFYGALDDAVLYSYARSAGEISSDSLGVHPTSVMLEAPRGNTTIGGAGAAGSAVLDMRFDEGQGPVAHSQVWTKAGTTTNLDTNPSFETDALSWSAQGDASISRVSGGVYGSYALSFTAPTGGWDGYIMAGVPNLVATRTYTASFYARTISGNASMQAVTNGGGGISAALTSTWQRFQYSFVSDTTGTKNFFFLLTSTGVSEIDGFQLEEKTSATPYCDGSLTGAGTHTWGGTAHASTSTCTYGQDGEINGATWTNSGKFGKALSFDGTDDYVQVPDNFALEPSQLTISTWVKTADADTYNNIVTKIGTTGYELLLSGNNARFTGYYSASVYGDVIGTSSVKDNAWHYIAATYDGANAKIYVDGRLENTTAYTSGITHDAGVLYIGKHGSRYLSGTVDEVKIYSFALTAEQVKQDYNHSAMRMGSVSTESNGVTASDSRARAYCVPGDTTSCAAPVAEWNFNEKAGTTLSDSSGNSNTGTISGATWGLGKIGSALKFDGTDDYANLGTSATLNPSTAITVEAWFNARSCSSEGAIVNKFKNDGSSSVYRIYCYGGSNLTADLWNSSGTRAYTNSTSWQTGVWNHASMTYDGSNIKLYINGQLKDSVAQTGTINSVLSEPLLLGARTSSSGTIETFFNGSVDGVRIYNYARTPAQIAWDYNNGAPVGHWKMDECQGSSVYDASGNNNTGTLTIGGSGTQTSAGTCTDSGTTAWYTGSSGKFNSSINFDGTDDYATVSDNDSLDFGTGDFTLGAWINTNALTTAQYIFSKGWTEGVCSNSGTQGYSLSFWTNGKIYLKVSTGSAQGCLEAFNNTALTAGWHYVMVTVSRSGNAVFYLDGKYDGQATASSYTNTISNNMPLRIVDYSGVSPHAPFNGQIDDVRIYNYALTATQVKNIYNQGSAVRF